jgi:hypothetical protein
MEEEASEVWRRREQVSSREKRNVSWGLSQSVTSQQPFCVRSRIVRKAICACLFADNHIQSLPP